MNANSVKSLSELLQANLHKNPELAAKQRRLLQTLSGDSSLPQPDASSASPTPEAMPATPQQTPRPTKP
jgi:hypothetical protein